METGETKRMKLKEKQAHLRSLLDQIEAGSRDVANILGVEGLGIIAMQSVAESMQEGLPPLRKEMLILAAAEATRQTMRLIDEQVEGKPEA